MHRRVPRLLSCDLIPARSFSRPRARMCLPRHTLVSDTTQCAVLLQPAREQEDHHLALLRVWAVEVIWGARRGNLRSSYSRDCLTVVVRLVKS